MKFDTGAWAAMNPETRDINALLPYARNSRTHSDAQVAQIAASMKEWGWTNPVLIDEDGMIIAGHGRVMAARVLGITVVPVIIARGWSEAKKRAYVIADNKLAMNAGWDEERLAEEIRELQDIGFDLDLTGFDKDEIYELLDGRSETGANPDSVPEPTVKPSVRAGDVFRLGDHRLICGDSTNPETYVRLLDGLKVDAVWTDPPYNVNYSSKAGKIENDNLSDADFGKFLERFFGALFDHVKPGAALYVAHADTEGLNFRRAFTNSGFKLSGCLIWVKSSLVLGRSDYQWQHEPILYGWRPGASHRWYGDRKQTTVIDDENGAVFSKQEDGSLLVRIGQQQVRVSGAKLEINAIAPTVLRVEKPKASDDHPTMKPTALICSLLKNSTRGGDIVLDAFGGSGSTMIACEMLGRQSRLIELEPKYCDVILRRWQEFTGKAAIREADGVKYDEIKFEKAPASAKKSSNSENAVKEPEDARAQSKTDKREGGGRKSGKTSAKPKRTGSGGRRRQRETADAVG